MMTVRRSPLDACHRALGAKIVAFGGWEMPLAYSQGTLAEHRACRTSAVVFDVSHLGTVEVTGEGAVETLQRALTNDLTKIRPGRAQYTHLLDDDGSVLDDLIVWWLPSDDDDDSGGDTASNGGSDRHCRRRRHVFHVMPNASNTDRVLGALNSEGCHARDITASRAVMAVQGPLARSRLASVIPETTTVRRFGVAAFEWRGVRCWIAGTGYTGEDGVECAVPAEAAADVWEAVLATGIPPAGLGARDTLRLEAGLPLHGHELGPGITPLQAGLEWVVAWPKGDFRGRAALEMERSQGPSRRLRGLVVEGRQPPRANHKVLNATGRVVGEVTSGNFSPTLEQGIALAFLAPEIPDGTRLAVDVRGRTMPASVVPIPFVPKAV